MPPSDAEPSQAPGDLSTWVRADLSRPHCSRPWRQIAVLSDGTAVCSCVDASKTNPLGNVFEQGVAAVWDGPGFAGLRRNIAGDIDAVPICRGCPNRIEAPPPAGFSSGAPKPRVLYLESHAGCNLACPGCDRQSIEGTRSTRVMDFDAYTRLIDELSPDLRYMEFHIGGENWMHPRAAEMVAYCKQQNPDCLVLTSTNGHFFATDAKAADALASGLDMLIVSVDGATQESYGRYRVNGSLDRSLEAMRRLVRVRAERGLTRPHIVWRYILFWWNDSPEELDAARALAAEIGVDELAWHLNGVRPRDSSHRYHVGSPHLAELAHELWDTCPERFGWDIDLGFASYPEPPAAG